MAITGASVSAYLRRAGFNPVAAADRSREGLRCTKSGNGVHVSADLDTSTAAKRMMDDVEAVLIDGGYLVERSTGWSFSAYVSR